MKEQQNKENIVKVYQTQQAKLYVYLLQPIQKGIYFKNRKTKQMTNLSGCIAPLWPGECWAFVRPVTKYADLVLILATKRKLRFTAARLTELNN